MAAGTGVSESPALLREHLLRHNAWQEVWRANAGERKRLSAAQRLALHAPKIQNQVVEAPDNCRSFWDSALFAIDCLVQAIHDGILAASGCGAGAPPLLGRGSLFPPDFQATIAAVISRTEGVRDGLSVRCAFVGIVRGVLSDVVVPDIEQFGPPGSGKRLERFGQWWEAFKVFSEFTRRFLQYHDRDTVPAAADASLLFQQRRTLGQGTGSGNSGRNPDPPRVESLSATSIRAWRDLVFVPLVRNDSAFVASLWEVIRRDRDEGNEGSPLFISLVENVMESAKARVRNDSYQNFARMSVSLSVLLTLFCFLCSLTNVTITEGSWLGIASRILSYPALCRSRASQPPSPIHPHELHSLDRIVRPDHQMSDICLFASLSTPLVCQVADFRIRTPTIREL